MVDPTREKGVRTPSAEPRPGPTPNSQINHRVVPGSLRSANPLPTNRLEHRAALRDQQNLTRMRDAQVHSGPVAHNGGRSPEGQRISAELSKQAQARQAAEQANAQKFESTRQKVGGPNLRAAGAGAGPTQAPGAGGPQAASAPTPTPNSAGSSRGAGGTLRGIYSDFVGRGEHFGPQPAKKALTGSRIVGGLSTGMEVYDQAGKVVKVAQNGGSGLDVATQGAEGTAKVAGSLVGAAAGAKAFGTLGAIAGPKGAAIGGLVGAGLGAYYGAEGVDGMIKTARGWLNLDEASPIERIEAQQAAEKGATPTAPGATPATPAPGQNTTPARAAAGLPPVKTGADAKLTAAQLNGYYDRTGMTNEQVGAMNPNGQIVVTRQPNGVMSFSDGGRPITSGPVSYVDADGKALPGQGLRGQGWGDTRFVPAGTAPTVSGGSFAAALDNVGQQPGQYRSNVEAQAKQLGVNIGGLSLPQAEQYMREVQQAQSIRAAQEANYNSYDYRLRQLADPTSDVSRAMKAVAGDIPDQIKGRGRWVADHQQKQAALAAGLAGDYLGETDRIRKDGTTRYGYDTQAESSRYSTDMNAAVNRENNAARLMADMQNAEVERASNQRKADEGRREKTQKRLDDVFTTMATKDGEVNPQRLAYLRNAAESYVATTANALEAEGRPEEAARLREQSVGALADPSTFQGFMGGLYLDDKVNEGYWGHERVASANPAGRTIMRRDGNTVYMYDGSTLPYGTVGYENGWLLPDRWGQWDITSDRVDTSVIDPYNRLHPKQ